MNMQSRSDSYAAAGVDITAGYRAVELMKTHIAKTMTAGALSDIGGFGGLFELDLTGISRPVLVSGTDGVGTKLKLAFLMDKHDTVGIDCVAMCVNDIICVGAKPLFFLDYIACGKNIPEKIADIVSGVAEGCVQSGASLIGGETAEMPGFYPVDEYDLAGFSVGVVDKAKVFDKTTIQPGDVILGLPSSGVHSNGFSLVRKVLDVEHADLKAPVEALGGRSLGETLLPPTRIYVKSILALMEQVQIKSVSHITGGGFYENIPRSLPQGMTAKIKEANVPVLPIFTLIEKAGSVPRREMFNTFNMGIGMTMVVAREEAENRVNEALAEMALGNSPVVWAKLSPATRVSSYGKNKDCRAGLRRRHQSAGPAGRPEGGGADRWRDRPGHLQQRQRLCPDPGCPGRGSRCGVQPKGTGKPSGF